MQDILEREKAIWSSLAKEELARTRRDLLPTVQYIEDANICLSYYFISSTQILKLLSLSQATYSLLSPCDSRKSCFTARFALSSHYHLFAPPHLLCWVKQTQNFVNTSSFPWASASPFHPQLLFPNLPPSTHSCSDRFLVLPPPPCSQVSSSLYFLELQLHKESVRTVSASTQTTSSTAAQLQPADSARSGSFQHQDSREETAEILAARRWLQSCAEVQSWGNHVLQSNNSEWPIWRFCD